MAGVYKRAARRAFASMQRWQRPSGELWIVKNRVDPSQRHGYEGYSHHSQYNLLAMAMLCIAHEHARWTEGPQVHLPPQEQVTPAELGGFLLDLRDDFHKVIANAGGSYVVVDVSGVPNNDATGLLRFHNLGGEPLLGPSDGIIHRGVNPVFAATGIAWRDGDRWRRLGEYHKPRIASVTLDEREVTADRVEFELEYAGEFDGVTSVWERYELTPEAVELTTGMRGDDGPTRIVWPVLATDGERETQIRVSGDEVEVQLEGAVQRFSVPGAQRVSVGEQLYRSRNGYMRIAEAEFAPGTVTHLRIEPVSMETGQ